MSGVAGFAEGRNQYKSLDNQENDNPEHNSKSKTTTNTAGKRKKKVTNKN